MFQPVPRQRVRVAATAAGALLVLILLLWLIIGVFAGHGRSGNGTGNSPAPGVQSLTGHFTPATMTCPGKKETPGTACVIDLPLPAGITTVTVTYPADALVALGMQDPKGKEVGPQTTGFKGKVSFVTPKVAAGTYKLRVVNVQLPSQPKTSFDFTVAISSAAS